jgi:integrase
MKYKEIHPRYDEKAGKWVVDIVIEGKRKQFSSKLPKAAGRRAVREKALLYLERETDKDGTKFGDVWTLYLQDYLRRHGENEQVRQIRTLGALFLLPRLAKRPTGKITIEEWQGILSDAKPRRRNGKLSKKYLLNIKGVISSFCRWAVPRGYMQISPADLLYVPASAPRGSRSILQLDDVSRLFSRRVGLWYERALLVEVLTGLRPGEVLGIQRQDIQGNALTICRAINARGIVTEGKNKNARRVIVCPPEVMQLINEQMKATERLRSPWLFCNKIGDQPSQAQLRRTWDRLIVAHDLPRDTSPYSLRHTFFTHTEAYLPERIIKQVFGHSDRVDSHRLYGAHNIEGEAAEAADRLQVTPLYNAASGDK